MKVGSLRLLRSLRTSIYSLMFIFGAALFTFISLQPYALIDFNRFKSDVLLQSQMSRNVTVFPYTIQYVDTLPYVYQFKSLVLWGLGVPLGVLGVLGILWISWHICHSEPKAKNPAGLLNINGILHCVQDDTINSTLILLSFFWVYFLFIGASAVKFMCYLLPLYPLLILAAAFLFIKFSGYTAMLSAKCKPSSRAQVEGVQSAKLRFKAQSFKSFDFLVKLFLLPFTFCTWLINGILVTIVLSAILFTFSFLSIYTKPHTRVTASYWINQNIPAGSTLATEHWDDELPLWGGEKYQRVKLNLYEPDNAGKVNELITKIVQADYIILSSNRLYASIPKLSDRYPITIYYYELLFSEKLGFEKIKEFTSYPHLIFDILHFEFRDSSADESFTVYDHPKVMIFKKTKRVDVGTLIKW